jgi:mannonate dehydratase
MNRRQFISSSSVAALAVGRGSGRGSTMAAVPAAPAAKPVLMKLGCQSAPTNDTHLKYLARYGVRNICGYPGGDDRGNDPNWVTVDALGRMKDLAAKNGIEVDCVGPPLLTSSYIDNEKHPAIMLAQSPERDR